MHFRLEEEVHRMVDFCGWNWLFSMEELIYRDVTLEVLSSFEIDRSLSRVLSALSDTISDFHRAPALE